MFALTFNAHARVFAHLVIRPMPFLMSSVTVALQRTRARFRVRFLRLQTCLFPFLVRALATLAARDVLAVLGVAVLIVVLITLLVSLCLHTHGPQENSNGTTLLLLVIVVVAVDLFLTVCAMNPLFLWIANLFYLHARHVQTDPVPCLALRVPRKTEDALYVFP